jgi:hypothetical protein
MRCWYGTIKQAFGWFSGVGTLGSRAFFEHPSSCLYRTTGCVETKAPSGFDVLVVSGAGVLVQHR